MAPLFIYSGWCVEGVGLAQARHRRLPSRSMSRSKWMPSQLVLALAHRRPPLQRLIPDPSPPISPTPALKTMLLPSPRVLVGCPLRISLLASTRPDDTAAPLPSAQIPHPNPAPRPPTPVAALSEPRLPSIHPTASPRGLPPPPGRRPHPQLHSLKGHPCTGWSPLHGWPCFGFSIPVQTGTVGLEALGDESPPDHAGSAQNSAPEQKQRARLGRRRHGRHAVNQDVVVARSRLAKHCD